MPVLRRARFSSVWVGDDGWVLQNLALLKLLKKGIGYFLQSLK
jgi:hypothetical protein